MLKLGESSAKIETMDPLQETTKMGKHFMRHPMVELNMYTPGYSECLVMRKNKMMINITNNYVEHAK